MQQTLIEIELSLLISLSKLLNVTHYPQTIISQSLFVWVVSSFPPHFCTIPQIIIIILQLLSGTN